MKRILNEGLDYHDLVGQIEPIVRVDEYVAKMGDDDEIVTLSFTVKGQQVGEDVVDWLERGYDFILDAQVSDGEITPGQYLVFVEMNRRTSVPGRICEMIEDMVTLTDLPLKEWTIIVDDTEVDADEQQLKSVMILSPAEYRNIHEEDLNEMRERAGLSTKNVFEQPDPLLKDFLSKAGL